MHCLKIEFVLIGNHLIPFDLELNSALNGSARLSIKVVYVIKKSTGIQVICCNIMCAFSCEKYGYVRMISYILCTFLKSM